MQAAISFRMVGHNFKVLLNQLTVEKFDSISDQIISLANKPENETDGRVLFQLAGLVFEKSMDEATSEMYARLCRKLKEQLNPKIQDDGFKDSEGKPILGGQLFRRFLLNRCQEDFERGCAANAGEGVKASEKDGKQTHSMYFDEKYAVQKAKRRRVGMFKFIGELFKVQMVAERVVHECVKKLLTNVDNPEEEDIESICKLLTVAGSILDTQKARAFMDIYISRMRGFTKNPHVALRLQLMVQDVIELRERKWMAIQSPDPTTVAQIHEAAGKEKAGGDQRDHGSTDSGSSDRV